MPLTPYPLELERAFLYRHLLGGARAARGFKGALRAPFGRLSGFSEGKAMAVSPQGIVHLFMNRYCHHTFFANFSPASNYDF